MAQSTHPLSASVVADFCVLCGRAYELWQNHVALFDGNPDPAVLRKSRARHTWVRLSIISQEYSLLQIVKLHDKAVMQGNVTLGIDFVFTYGGWSGSVRTRLDELARQLDGFASQLKGARNKILSHNDLATIVAGGTLGNFAKGDDENYFEALQEFVNIVYDQVIGGTWSFKDHVNPKVDVADFIARLDLK
jgi:hypothetical protein